MRTLLFILLLAGLASAAQAGFLDFLLRRDVQVIVNTDMTPAGALLRTPSKENPVYYIAVSAGYRDLGGVMGGDKLPEKEAMHRFIAKALAKQGYLPATDNHAPTQLLLFTWGSLYVISVPSFADIDLPDVQTNRGQMLRFLGGEKLGLISKNPQLSSYESIPGLSILTPSAQQIRDISGDDLYMAAIASYDLQAAKRKERRLLWMTRISCPSAGLVMADTLPTMLSIATPHIGRETTTPVWIDASDKFKADVKVGIPTVDEYLDSGTLPIIEGRDPKKK